MSDLPALQEDNPVDSFLDTLTPPLVFARQKIASTASSTVVRRSEGRESATEYLPHGRK